MANACSVKEATAAWEAAGSPEGELDRFKLENTLARERATFGRMLGGDDVVTDEQSSLIAPRGGFGVAALHDHIQRCVLDAHAARHWAPDIQRESAATLRRTLPELQRLGAPVAPQLAVHPPWAELQKWAATHEPCVAASLFPDDPALPLLRRMKTAAGTLQDALGCRPAFARFATCFAQLGAPLDCSDSGDLDTHAMRTTRSSAAATACEELMAAVHAALKSGDSNDRSCTSARRLIDHIVAECAKASDGQDFVGPNRFPRVLGTLTEVVTDALGEAHSAFERTVAPLVDPHRIRFQVDFQQDSRSIRAIVPADPDHFRRLPDLLQRELFTKASIAVSSALDTFPSRLQQSPELLEPSDEYTAAATKVLDAVADALEQHATSSRLLQDHPQTPLPESQSVNA